MRGSAYNAKSRPSATICSNSSMLNAVPPPLPPSVNDGRMIAGVCAGLAERFEVPVTVLRLAFVLGGLFSWLGPAVILYIVLWVIMPAEEPVFDDEFADHAERRLRPPESSDYL